MASARPGRRAGAVLAAGLAGLVALAGVGPVGGGQAVAQTGGQPFLSLGEGPPVVTLDQERLFAESAFGRRVTAAVEASARNLAAENRALEEALSTEERSLTELRPTLPVEEFRALADAFDARVEEIRARQEGRSRAIAEFRDIERQRFFELALPLLAQVVVESGAVAVLDRRAIVLAVDDIDITDRVRARLDQVLGDGAGGAPAAPIDPPVLEAPAPLGPALPPAAPGSDAPADEAPAPAAPDAAAPGDGADAAPPLGGRAPMPRPALPGGPPLDLTQPPGVD